RAVPAAATGLSTALIDGADEVEQRGNGARRVEIVVQGSRDVGLEFLSELVQLCSPLPAPCSAQSLMKFAKPPHALLRGLERLVREIHRLAIVRLKKQEPHCRRIHALLAQIARREKVSVPLRHLGAAHVQEFAVYPMARERPARRSFGLRDFVFVMRKNQIDPAGVNVERLNLEALANFLQ